MTLMATSRLSLRSRARYTSPIPPDPSEPAISYCARRVPGVSDTSGMVREFLFHPAVRSITARFEHVTVIHLAAVDVERDGGLGRPPVGQRVVLERRNQ